MKATYFVKAAQIWMLAPSQGRLTVKRHWTNYLLGLASAALFAFLCSELGAGPIGSYPALVLSLLAFHMGTTIWPVTGFEIDFESRTVRRSGLGRFKTESINGQTITVGLIDWTVLEIRMGSFVIGRWSSRNNGEQVLSVVLAEATWLGEVLSLEVAVSEDLALQISKGQIEERRFNGLLWGLVSLMFAGLGALITIEYVEALWFSLVFLISAGWCFWRRPRVG